MPRPLKVVSPDTLGGRIRAARQAQGLSLAEVAGKVYSTSLISQIERNKIEPSADSLKYLAERLHLPMDELTHLAEQSRESEAETHQYQKIEEKRLLATQLLETNHPLRALEQLENLPLARAPVTLRWRIIALRGQCYFNMREFLLAQQEFRAAFSILPDYIPPRLAGTGPVRGGPYTVPGNARSHERGYSVALCCRGPLGYLACPLRAGLQALERRGERQPPEPGGQRSLYVDDAAISYIRGECLHALQLDQRTVSQRAHELPDRAD